MMARIEEGWKNGGTFLNLADWIFGILGGGPSEKAMPPFGLPMALKGQNGNEHCHKMDKNEEDGQ
jgi:hypothetical protein